MQAAPYSYNAQRILRMLWRVAGSCGNLLLNIGPAPDGSVPPEAVEPLTKVGQWLAANGDAVYGQVDPAAGEFSVRSTTRKKNRVYVWNWIWPDNGEFTLGGYRTKLVSARLLPTGESLPFTQDAARITVSGLPLRCPDPVCGVGVAELTFAEEPEQDRGSLFPQLHGGARLLWSFGLRDAEFHTPGFSKTAAAYIYCRSGPPEYDGAELTEAWRVQKGAVLGSNANIRIPKDAQMFYILIEGKTGGLFSRQPIYASTGIFYRQ